MALSENFPWLPSLRRTRREEFGLAPLQRQMNRWMEEMMSDFRVPAMLEGGEVAFMPRITVKESESEISVRADLPGVNPEDIEISLSDRGITLRGERREEREEEDRQRYYMEQSYGAFERYIPLDAEVDESKVDARFRRGVLEISLPKTQEARAKTRKIEVKSSEEGREEQPSNRTSSGAREGSRVQIKRNSSEGTQA